jgi:uncharacterized coiled-coil protein SlyX
MGETSDVLMKLRPVSFRYREEVVGDGAGTEYGLIAEEVAEVAPELVTADTEGNPYSVRYHVLPSLLLNEFQQQQRTIEEQRAMLGEQRAMLGEQREVIAALAGRLERVEQSVGTRVAGNSR